MNERFVYRAKHVVRSALRFGFRATRQAFFSTSPLSEVYLPTLSNPVYLRSDDVDREVFAQVFLDEQYGYIKGAAQVATIVDAGAHIGLASVHFARLFPEARVIALEPDAANFELLCRNVAPFSNVTPLRAALWHRTGKVSIQNPDAASFAFAVKDTDGDGISAFSVPDLMRQIGTSRIDVFKMDIEGAEKPIFEHHDGWLGSVGVLLIELHDRMVPGCARSVYRTAVNYPFLKFQSGEVDVLDFRT